MGSKFSYLILLTLPLVMAISCERKDDNGGPIAGKGGNATFKITPVHHSENIDSSTVYIKYNAQDAAHHYDDSAVCVIIDGKPVATFSQLKQGKYYLFGKGWDPSIFQKVQGGMPYSITRDSTYELLLPVTEVH